MLEIMELRPREVQNLVCKAFCLEAIADKSGCTGRYVDIEGKPLEDFIIAAINVSDVFAGFAADWQAGSRSIFSRQVEALLSSNWHKSNKFINLGLLEIMFPVVAARLTCAKPDKVIDTVLNIMKKGDNKDVANMIAAREVAWSSSLKKTQKLLEVTKETKNAPSPIDYYKLVRGNKEPPTSRYQWSQHYLDGLPLLQKQFEYLQSHTDGGLMLRIKNGFDPLRAANPDIKIGILADMCAAAIFLHLSFLDT